MPGALLQPSVGSADYPPDQNFLYFDIDTAYYERQGLEPPLYEISTTEAWGDSVERDSVSNCEILYNEGVPSSEDLICIVDMMEQELYLADGENEPISFVLNVPKEMCPQLRTIPSWHWNKKAGIGPKEIYKGECESPSSNSEDTDKKDFYCLESSDASPDQECRTVNPVCYIDGADEPKEGKLCGSYYHSEKENCCLGKYEVRDMGCRKETPPNSGSYAYIDCTEEDWGGEAKQCMGGHGRTSWDAYDKDGFPVAEIENTFEGTRKTIKIENIYSVLQRTGYSSPAANYFKPLDNAIEDLRDQQLPDFLEPIKMPTGLSETEIRDLLKEQPIYGISPKPYYDFVCMDFAGEIKHRISFMIREWNTAAEFMAFYESAGEADSADPDIEGIEGEDCDYEDRQLFQGYDRGAFCDDFDDLDDLVTSSTEYPGVDYELER